MLATDRESTAREDDAGAVIQALAAFLKSDSIYPSDHPRVLESADSLLQLLDARVGPLTWLTLRVGNDAFQLGGDSVPATAPLPAWLRQRLQDAALAGIEIGAGIDRETLTAFAAALRSGRNGPGFAQVWPADHPRLRPIDLVFTGGHVDDPGDDGSAGIAGREVWKQDLVRQLTLDPSVADRLQALRLNAAESGRGENLQVALLGGIVELLSSEIAQDASRAGTVVTQVLDAIRVAMSVEETSQKLTVDSELLRLALGVARKYFDGFAAPVAPQAEPAPLPSGRPEDERIVDDLTELLAELTAIPESKDLRLPLRRDLESGADAMKAELLGIYLHLLPSMMQSERLDSLRKCIERCLADVGPRQQAVLDAYLAPEAADTGIAAADVRHQMVDHFHRLGLGQHLLQRGYLDDDLVAKVFPAHFVRFVQSLTDRLGDQQRLRKVLAAIDPNRLQIGAQLMRHDGQLRDRQLVDRLAAAGGPHLRHLMAEVAALDEDWARARTTLYLFTQELPRTEALALHNVFPPGVLPAQYLVQLCSLVGASSGNPQLAQQSAQLLRDFVAGARAPEHHERRLKAMRSLAAIPGPETRSLLEQLANEGRFTRFGRTARETRRTAGETLAQMQRNGDRST